MVTFNSFGEDTASGSGGGSTSFSFTNSAGNLLLGAFFFDSAAGSVSSTGVYYGGVQLTELYNHKTGGNLLWVGYLVAPATGSNTFAVNGTIDTNIHRAACITFSGVDQTTPLGGTASNFWENNTTTPKTLTATVSGDSGVVVDFFLGGRTNSGNATSPQVEKMNNTGSWNGGVNHLGGISYAEHTGSNVTMSWENLSFQSSAADQEYYAVELIAAPVTGGGMFMAV